MRNLPPPTDENAQLIEAGEVFARCVSMVRDAALRVKLLSILQNVETAAADYDAKAADKQLYRKRPHHRIGNVSSNEMVKVYTLRMVPKSSRGRHIYDRILSAPVHGRCPMCGIGTVNTLDHYLPKTHFPVYAVTPNNLVPACSWCQGEKAEYYPTTEGEQLLHPYFDNIENEVWLVAEVIVGAPAGFRFFTLPPDHWTAAAKARVTAHLKKLNLPMLFSSNAGSRLAEIRDRLQNLYQGGGSEAIRAHLSEELASIEADYMNSWVAAMYRASIASDWFCDGGFSGT